MVTPPFGLGLPVAGLARRPAPGVGSRPGVVRVDAGRERHRARRRAAGGARRSAVAIPAWLRAEDAATRGDVHAVPRRLGALGLCRTSAHQLRIG
jgi:hypothetical protein